MLDSTRKPSSQGLLDHPGDQALAESDQMELVCKGKVETLYLLLSSILHVLIKFNWSRRTSYEELFGTQLSMAGEVGYYPAGLTLTWQLSS
jgi:hypothetical protein